MRERAADDYDFRAATERWEQAYEGKCGEVVRLTAECDELKKELKQARIDWESERDYADQCEERLMELTGETNREENGMTKKQLKKDYKRLLKQIDELDERIDKERLDTEDYRLMRAMYFTMCAIEGLLRHRIETM